MTQPNRKIRPSELVHEKLLRGRRVRVLSDHVARMIPEGSSVLDVGSGDGRIALRILNARPDLSIRGIDVLIRPDTAIEVEQFDGTHMPFRDDSFDVVSFVDVLHHTDDPESLLVEAARVSRKTVVIKDHLCQGPLAAPTLRLMDRVGNKRHGVEIPYNYLTLEEWQSAFTSAGLSTTAWQSQLGIYPWPASLLFDRRLHFAASLTASSE